MPEVSVVWHYFVFAAPFLAIAAVWWLIHQTERLVHHLFPHLEWEKSLGWLNIRAERRVEAAMRWIGYGVYAILIVALYGIVWAAQGLQALDNLWDPWVMGDLALRVPVLFICLGVWFLYLGCGLIPKLRRQRERKEWAELKRFREEAEEAEKERERHSPSRVKSPLLKPRTDATLEPFVPERTRRRP